MIVLYIVLAILAFLFVVWLLYQIGLGPLMLAIIEAILDDSGPTKGGGGGSKGSWGGGGGFGGGGGGSSW